MVNDVPVPNDEPPDDAAYQLMVPEFAVAPKATVPSPHLEFGVVPVIAGNPDIVTVLVAVALEQPPVPITV